MIAMHGDLFDDARAALDEGELDDAAELAARGLAACARAGAPTVAAAPGHYVLGAVAAESDEDDVALEHADRACAADPAFGEAAHLAARLRLSRWDLVGAAAVLAACQERPAHPDLHYLAAVVAELQGQFDVADEHYRAAAAVDPEGYPLPVRISDEELQRLVEATIEAMPPSVVATFRNLTIDVHEVPDPVLHRDVHPETLGLYAGTPVGDAEAMPVGLPDRVYIFKRNIERMAQDREELIEELRITLLHELGHHLGWDEDDLEARGLA